MAEAAIESTSNEAPLEASVAVHMEVEDRVSIEETNGAEGQEKQVNGGTKRERDEEEGEGEEANFKKAKVEKSVEEERLDKNEEENKEAEDDEGEEGEEEGEEEEGQKEEIKEVKLGPKVFTSSQDMFDYFFKLLHNWSPNIDINKYEHTVLMDLLKTGHSEPNKKIGKGMEAFVVRYHPVYKSRCFFVRRIDGSSDDFSFRKCVDAIIPLPDELKIKPIGGRTMGGRVGGGRGGGRGGGGGRRGRRGWGRGRG